MRREGAKKEEIGIEVGRIVEDVDQKCQQHEGLSLRTGSHSKMDQS
jgi:hypothetical protein